jgi:hypothetical protein
MITFSQFLAEGKKQQGKKSEMKLKKALAGIKRDCQPFLLANKSVLSRGQGLYRGIASIDWDTPALLVNVRTNRLPADMPEHMHKIVDDYFKQKFGHPYRSAAAFASGDETAAAEYGVVCAIFPVGEYTFSTSKNVIDLFSIFQNTTKLYDTGISFGNYSTADICDRVTDIMDSEDDGAEATEFIVNVLDALKYKETTKIPTTHFNEIMVNCEKYYAVSLDAFEEDSYDNNSKKIKKLMRLIYD